MEEYYKHYQKNGDAQVKEIYYDLGKQSLTNLPGLKKIVVMQKLEAVKKVIAERNLKVKKIERLQPDSSEKPTKDFNKYLKKGRNSFLIGITLFSISLLLFSYFPAYKFVLLGVIIGGFKLIQGAIELSVGLYIRVNQAKKF